jgi:hypothetical protein
MRRVLEPWAEEHVIEPGASIEVAFSRDGRRRRGDFKAGARRRARSAMPLHGPAPEVAAAIGNVVSTATAKPRATRVKKEAG